MRMRPDRQIALALRSLLLALMAGWVLGQLPSPWPLLAAGLFLVWALALAYLEVRYARAR